MVAVLRGIRMPEASPGAGVRLRVRAVAMLVATIAGTMAFAATGSPDGIPRPTSPRIEAGGLLVNSAGDAGPGNCNSTCTLRDAISIASSGGSISFSAGILPATITLTQGELAIAKPLTILGPVGGSLAISANNAGRVLGVTSGNVAISDVTLRDGNVTGSKGFTGSPGSASTGGQGDPAAGGCVSIAAGASLILTRVDVRNCSVHGGAGGDGTSGPDNSATFSDPGIDGGAGGPAGIGSGGAISVAGSLTLLDSTVSAAAVYGGAGGRGGDGGIGGFAVPNGSGGNGGAGADGRGACVYVAPSASAWLQNTTLSTSHADGGAGGQGGTATSMSSSVHGGNGGPGGSGRGGLLFVDASATLVDLEFSTLADGIANAGSGGQLGLGLNGAAPGGSGNPGSAIGAAVGASSAVNALSSVIVGTAAVSLCSPANFTIGVGVANLDQDSSCTGFALHGTRDGQFRAFDAASVRPAYMPRYGSTVIDAATTCKDLSNASVLFDEKGTPRPQGAKCDLGTVEADYIFVGVFESVAT
jgi:CSLREA domain-containing protein